MIPSILRVKVSVPQQISFLCANPQSASYFIRQCCSQEIFIFYLEEKCFHPSSIKFDLAMLGTKKATITHINYYPPSSTNRQTDKFDNYLLESPKKFRKLNKNDDNQEIFVCENENNVKGDVVGWLLCRTLTLNYITNNILYRVSRYSIIQR